MKQAFPGNTRRATLKNKTVSVDDNIVTDTWTVDFVAGGCKNATASPGWDLPASNGLAEACYGTSPHKYGALDAADGANALTSTLRLLLPSTVAVAAACTSPGQPFTCCTGSATGCSLDLKIIWECTSSSGCSTNNVIFTVATKCIADTEDLDNPTYNSTQNITDASSATRYARNSATLTGVTVTGCAAGELLFVKVGRDPTNGTDTLAATATITDVELTGYKVK